MRDHEGDHASRWRTVVVFLAVAFVLQWAWEIVHGVAYVETDMALADRVWHCLPMAVVDAAWSAGLVLAATGVAHSLGQPWLTFPVTVAAGALTAAWVEHAAIKSGRWTYNALMPIVPIVDVGVWPVLQMSLLPPVALLIARRAREARHVSVPSDRSRRGEGAEQRPRTR